MSSDRQVSRRTVLGGLAAAGAAAVLGGRVDAWNADDGGLLPDGFDPQTPVESHHPGQPRFVSVGEPVVNPVWTVGADTRGFDDEVGNVRFEKGRDNLAPRLPSLSAVPNEYSADAFEWTLVDWPDDSGGPGAVLFFGDDPRASTVDGENLTRYYEGRDNVAYFQADAAGEYRLELDAPDGTHELTLYAFEAGAGGAGVYQADDADAPRLELDADYDAGADEFVVETNAASAPTANTTRLDLEATFLADDRDALDTDAIDVAEDGLTATIPADALDGESARVHAAVFDTRAATRSTQDVVVLEPSGEVDLPNRPPEWIEDAVMYQLFPRSWAGQRQATTFETLIEGDDAARGLDYLEELGVDVVWLTPVVPATSTQRQFGQDPYDEPELAGGGPHGYDTADYTSISPDLVPEGYDDPVDVYREFVNECHERDIKVLFDIVVNHAGRTNELFQRSIATKEGEIGDDMETTWPVVTEWDDADPTFDWWDRVEAPRLNEDGDVLVAQPRTVGFADLTVMPNMNYDTVALREYVLSVADFWTRPQDEGGAGVDGFRADIAYGVPQSFWKEVREIGRANDADHLMFDETVPRNASLAESEFDLHHDTAGFLTTAQDVVLDDAGPGAFYDDVIARARDGIPDHSLLINALENHDEHRALNQAAVDLTDPDHDAIDDGVWEFHANRLRVCFAAAVAFPGVPHVYYGQERQISRFGEGRHLGAGDDRGINDDGSINVSADVRPGGRQRAFVNWETVPDEHLSFYRDAIDLYHEYEVLQAGPELTIARFSPVDGAEAVAFGRNGRELDDVDGPEAVVFVLNAEQGTAEIELPRHVDTVDLYTGEDLEVEAIGADANTVAVERELALFEVEELGSDGDLVASWDGGEHTDYGAGRYRYPEADAFPSRAFDLRSVECYETADDYEFVYRFHGQLDNPWSLDEDFSVQKLQVYLGDGSGTTEAPTGVNATTSKPYSYLIDVDGTGGAIYDASDGLGDLATETSVTESVDVEASFVDSAVRFSVPRDAIDGDLADMDVAPVVCSFDGNQPSGVRRVNAVASEWEFGGGENDDSNPNVIDVATPSAISQTDALDWQASDPEIPLFDVASGSPDPEERAAWARERWTDGDGTYTDVVDELEGGDDE